MNTVVLARQLIKFLNGIEFGDRVSFAKTIHQRRAIFYSCTFVTILLEHVQQSAIATTIVNKRFDPLVFLQDRKLFFKLLFYFEIELIMVLNRVEDIIIIATQKGIIKVKFAA